MNFTCFNSANKRHTFIKVPIFLLSPHIACCTFPSCAMSQISTLWDKQIFMEKCRKFSRFLNVVSKSKEYFRQDASELNMSWYHFPKEQLRNYSIKRSKRERQVSLFFFWMKGRKHSCRMTKAMCQNFPFSSKSPPYRPSCYFSSN